MKNMKSMKKAVALLLALFLMTGAAAAETAISVTGTGETRVSADTAVISLGISARDQDVLRAQQKANEAIAAIRNALAAEGIPEEDISTDYMNIYALYDYSTDQEQVTAYNANSTLAIRVTDLDSAGRLIDAAFSAGANTLNGITFSASDTSLAKAESMKKAVDDAKNRAEILAEAAGLKITGISAISDSGVFSLDNTVSNFSAKSMGRDEAAAGTVVQAAKLIVTATVNITFTAE